MTPSARTADLCVVGLGPAGRALAHRAVRAGFEVVAVDPRPERPWLPTYSCWVDELPKWLPDSAVGARIPAPAVWARSEHRIDRPYCVLSARGLFDAFDLTGATVLATRAAVVDTHSVTTLDGTVIRAATVVDARGLPTPGRRPAASAHGIFVDTDRAAGLIDGGGGLLLDWRDENGADPGAPPSFLYAVPVGDGTVLFEETSLGLRGGMPQHELRRRALHRLARHGIRLRGTERTEAAHYPLDQPPPKLGVAGPIPFGARGGTMHPCTGYSVADSLAATDVLLAALRDGRDPVAALWSPQARVVYWLRTRGLHGLGRLDTAQCTTMFEAFFTSTPRQQRALLSEHEDYPALVAALVGTVARTRPFHWRFDMVGWRRRHRRRDHTFPVPDLPVLAQRSDPVLDPVLPDDRSVGC